MAYALTLFLYGSLLATLGALVFGLYVYFKGGEANEKWGNKAMQYRIYFQALALFIMFCLLMFKIK